MCFDGAMRNTTVDPAWVGLQCRDEVELVVGADKGDTGREEGKGLSFCLCSSILRRVCIMMSIIHMLSDEIVDQLGKRVFFISFCVRLHLIV